MTARRRGSTTTPPATLGGLLAELFVTAPSDTPWTEGLRLWLVELSFEERLEPEEVGRLTVELAFVDATVVSDHTGHKLQVTVSAHSAHTAVDYTRSRISMELGRPVHLAGINVGAPMVDVTAPVYSLDLSADAADPPASRPSGPRPRDRTQRG